MGRVPLLLPWLPESLALAWAGLVTVVVAASPSWAGSQDTHGPLPAQLQPLVLELQAYGFQIRLAPPPKRGAYGLFESKSRTLWIAPVTIPLGIARQTFLPQPDAEPRLQTLLKQRCRTPSS